jgi:hypothetical protein
MADPAASSRTTDTAAEEGLIAIITVLPFPAVPQCAYTSTSLCSSPLAANTPLPMTLLCKRRSQKSDATSQRDPVSKTTGYRCGHRSARKISGATHRCALWSRMERTLKMTTVRCFGRQFARTDPIQQRRKTRAEKSFEPGVEAASYMSCNIAWRRTERDRSELCARRGAHM